MYFQYNIYLSIYCLLLEIYFMGLNQNYINWKETFNVWNYPLTSDYHSNKLAVPLWLLNVSQASVYVQLRAMCPCFPCLSGCQHFLIVLSGFSDLVSRHCGGTEVLMSGIVIWKMAPFFPPPAKANLIQTAHFHSPCHLSRNDVQCLKLFISKFRPPPRQPSASITSFSWAEPSGSLTLRSNLIPTFSKVKSIMCR